MNDDGPDYRLTQEIDMQELAPVQELPVTTVTPMMMLQTAVAKGADLEQLQKLMDLQDRWEKNEARKAYVTAITAFKQKPPDVLKKKDVSFGTTKYKHATLDNASELIGAALSEVGISHRWNVEQLEGGIIKVTCILTHVQGHSESVSMQAMADTSGSKNSIQAIGSTTSYLQRYTLFSATGIAAKDQDDDGRGSSKPAVDPDEAGKKALEACGSEDSLKKAWAGLTEAQRKTLNGVMAECKKAIREAL